MKATGTIQQGIRALELTAFVKPYLEIKWLQSPQTGETTRLPSLGGAIVTPCLDMDLGRLHTPSGTVVIGGKLIYFKNLLYKGIKGYL